MRTFRFADPSNAKAQWFLECYKQGRESNAPIWVVSLFACTVFFGVPAWASIIIGDPAIMKPGWLIAAILWLFAAAGVTWYALTAKTLKQRYQRELEQGTIIEVPQVLMDIWDRRIAIYGAFERWREFEQRRFQALRKVVTDNRERLMALAEECECGTPATCDSEKHLLSSIRQQHLDRLRQQVDQALEPHLAAFTAHLAEYYPKRAAYNHRVASIR